MDQDEVNEPQSILLSPDTLKSLDVHTEADHLEEAVGEAAQKAARYDEQIDFQRYRLADVCNRIIDQRAIISSNILGRIAWGGVLIAILLITYQLEYAAVVGVIYAGVVIGPIIPRFRRLSALANHLESIGVGRDLDDLSVLMEADSQVEAMETLSQMDGLPRMSDRDPVLEQSSETEEEQDPNETEQVEPPRLWVSKSAFKQIDALRSDDLIEPNSWTDEVFKEIRVQRARKDDPVIEMDESDLIDLQTDLNFYTETGSFMYKSDSTGEYRKLVYQDSNDNAEES